MSHFLRRTYCFRACFSTLLGLSWVMSWVGFIAFSMPAQAMFGFGYAYQPTVPPRSPAQLQAVSVEQRKRSAEQLQAERARGGGVGGRRHTEGEGLGISIEEMHRQRAEEARTRDPLSSLKSALERRVLAFTQEVKRGEDGKPLSEGGVAVAQTPKIITGLLERVTQVQGVSRCELTYQSESGAPCATGKRFCLTQNVFPAVSEYRGIVLGQTVDIEYSSALEDPDNAYFSEYFGADSAAQNRALPRDPELFGESLNVGVGFCQGKVTGLFFRQGPGLSPYVSKEADGLIEVETYGCYGYDPADGSHIALPEFRKTKYWKFTKKIIPQSVAAEAVDGKWVASAPPAESRMAGEGGGGAGGGRSGGSDPSAPEMSSLLDEGFQSATLMGAPLYLNYAARPSAPPLESHQPAEARYGAAPHPSAPPSPAGLAADPVAIKGNL